MSDKYRITDVGNVQSMKEKVVLVFNRLNGLFLMVSNVPYEMTDLNDPHCIYIQAEMNMTEEEVEGHLKINDDGSYVPEYKIVRIDERIPTIHEEQLDNHVAYKITERYTVVKQINILTDVIKRLAVEAGLETEELDEYIEYVKLVKQTNNDRKQFYKETDTVIYVSKEQMAEESIAKFEGGLHEVIGPRTIDGGTVF